MPENSENVIGYSALTPLNLLLDSGALYKNYGIVGKEILIGATAGGNEFSVTVKTRDVKVDGVKGVSKGLRFITDTEITMKTNMLEVTTDILKMALLGEVDSATNVDYDIITGKTYIADTDYLDNIALVGKISGSLKPVIVILKNVLNTDGLKFKTEDDKDNVLPITFSAFQDPMTPNILPYEVRYPKAKNSVPFYVIGTPIIANAKVLLTLSGIVGVTVPKDGFVVKVNSVADVVTTSVRGVNNLNTIELTLTTPATSGQIVTVEYIKPVADALDVKSLSGIALATFTALKVTNN